MESLKPTEETDNAEILRLFSASYQKGPAPDMIEHTVNIMLIKIAEAFPGLIKQNPNTFVVCGSSAEGLKVTPKGDVGDIDVFFAGRRKVEESRFIYHDKFPCFCKIQDDDGSFLHIDVVNDWRFHDLGKYLWNKQEVVKNYRAEGIGVDGFVIDNVIGKYEEYVRFIFLFGKCCKEIKRRFGDYSPESFEQGMSSLKENYKPWEDEYQANSVQIKLSLGMYILRAMRQIRESSNPRQEDLTGVLRCAFFQDSISLDAGTFQDLIVAISQLSQFPKLSFDLIYGLDVEGWPRVAVPWISRKPRQWPGTSVIDKIITQGFRVVGKAPPLQVSERSWYFYLSFNRAEIALCNTFNEVQRGSYVILKSIIKYGQRFDIVKTYHLKTTYFWVCEETANSKWTEDLMTECLKLVLNKLIECMETRYLPHYFVPEMNLLAAESDEDCQTTADNLTDVKENVAQYLQEVAEKSGPFVMFDAVET